MDRFLEANRALWDEWTEIHVRSRLYDLTGFRQGGVRLRPYELDEVGAVRGKTLLHLQCHFGIDSLSWARLGADVTGVDFSPKAIAQASALAAELRIGAAFICSDIDALPDRLQGEFDIVYTSRGVLGWLPDLERWARVIAHFLRPEGFFYITEAHPVVQVWDDEPDARGLRLGYPYFERAAPLELPVRGSYADRDAPVRQAVEYGWTHSLGQIVTSLAQAGLRIDFLRERAFLEWEAPFLVTSDGNAWRLPPDAGGELPLSFSLKATKAGISD
jgi:SAM-dependent methyltransferase